MECFCDYEPAEFYQVKNPRAKKEYRCCECGSVIGKGERYERATGKWDGRFDTFKACPDCVSIRKAFQEMDCFCWSHGGLWEDIQNQFDFADFTPGGRFAYLRLVAMHRKNKRPKIIRHQESTERRQCYTRTCLNTCQKNTG